jgi:hypothetical protein
MTFGELQIGDRFVRVYEDDTKGRVAVKTGLNSYSLGNGRGMWFFSETAAGVMRLRKAASKPRGLTIQRLMIYVALAGLILAALINVDWGRAYDRRGYSYQWVSWVALGPVEFLAIDRLDGWFNFEVIIGTKKDGSDLRFRLAPPPASPPASLSPPPPRRHAAAAEAWWRPRP